MWNNPADTITPIYWSDLTIDFQKSGHVACQGSTSHPGANVTHLRFVPTRLYIFFFIDYGIQNVLENCYPQTIFTPSCAHFASFRDKGLGHNNVLLLKFYIVSVTFYHIPPSWVRRRHKIKGAEIFMCVCNVWEFLSKIANESFNSSLVLVFVSSI